MKITNPKGEAIEAETFRLEIRGKEFTLSDEDGEIQVVSKTTNTYIRPSFGMFRIATDEIEE